MAKNTLAHETRKNNGKSARISKGKKARALYLRLRIDQVYSGFAVAGSAAAEQYPVPSLRLILKNGETVLLDRGSFRRLETLGKRLVTFLAKPLQTEAALMK